MPNIVKKKKNSVTPLGEKHPPQHTQDVQALPPKIPNL